MKTLSIALLLMAAMVVLLVGCQLSNEPVAPVDTEKNALTSTVGEKGGEYNIIDLGVGPATDSYAYDVNNLGQVVGELWDQRTGDNHAFLWEGGVMKDLGSGPALRSRAYGINERGQIVGSLEFPSNSHAFLWEGGVFTDLHQGPDNSHTIAWSINNNGQIVGVFDLQGEERSIGRAVLWDDGLMAVIGPTGDYNSAAFSINNRGEVVGGAELPNGEGSYGPVAFIWWRGSFTRLTALGHAGGALAINDKGEVIGYDTDVNAEYGQNVLWRSGQMFQFGGHMEGWGINNNSQVVGELPNDFPSTEFTIPCVWKRGVVIELPTLGGRWNYAWKISESGDVIGYCSTPDELNTHAVLWSRTMRPVPTLSDKVASPLKSTANVARTIPRTSPPSPPRKLGATQLLRVPWQRNGRHMN